MGHKCDVTKRFVHRDRAHILSRSQSLLEGNTGTMNEYNAYVIVTCCGPNYSNVSVKDSRPLLRVARNERDHSFQSVARSEVRVTKKESPLITKALQSLIGSSRAVARA